MLLVRLLNDLLITTAIAGTFVVVVVVVVERERERERERELCIMKIPNAFGMAIVTGEREKCSMDSAVETVTERSS